MNKDDEEYRYVTQLQTLSERHKDTSIEEGKTQCDSQTKFSIFYFYFHFYVFFMFVFIFYKFISEILRSC